MCIEISTTFPAYAQQIFDVLAVDSEHPVMLKDLRDIMLANFFECHQFFFPLVYKSLFMGKRDLFYSSGIIESPYSLSTEYAVFCLVANDEFKDINFCNNLAMKARRLLETEIRAALLSSGVLQACLLLPLLEFDNVTYYCSLAARFISHVGLHRVPRDSVFAILCWNFFVMDR